MLRAWNKLKQNGILGINQRNADFTAIYNPRHLHPLVDNKLITKKLAAQAGISVPELYCSVHRYGELNSLVQLLKSHSDFVIKPAHGSGGKGILVIAETNNDSFRSVDGTIYSYSDLRYHILNILGGMYSLAGHTDTAMIEYRVKFDPIFEQISYLGVPDIRIVVFLGVPVMAMIRLPTRMSRGKANLHQGAIGSGIDLKTGLTQTAVWNDKIISHHPDTGSPVFNLKIPSWESLLELSSTCYEITGLGYLGVDIVLDKTKGPMILELNARPGLNIQIANKSGLLPRLKLVENNISKLKTLSDKIDFVQESF